MSNRALVWTVAVVVVVAVILAGGCPKKVREAAEVARTVGDAQDGSFTMKGEKGEEVKVEAKGEGEEGGSVTVTGPDGTTKSEFGEDAVKQEDVGIDFYPGATVQGGGKASGGKGGSWAAVGLETKDPFDKVASFYKGKYAEGNTVIESPGSLMITIDAGENKGKFIMVAEDKDKGVTTIAIHAGEGA